MPLTTLLLPPWEDRKTTQHTDTPISHPTVFPAQWRTTGPQAYVQWRTLLSTVEFTHKTLEEELRNHYISLNSQAGWLAGWQPAPWQQWGNLVVTHQQHKNWLSNHRHPLYNSPSPNSLLPSSLMNSSSRIPQPAGRLWHTPLETYPAHNSNTIRQRMTYINLLQVWNLEMHQVHFLHTLRTNTGKTKRNVNWSQVWACVWYHFIVHCVCLTIGWICVDCITTHVSQLIPMKSFNEQRWEGGKGHYLVVAIAKLAVGLVFVLLVVLVTTQRQRTLQGND